MKLKNGDNLAYANNLINHNLLNKSENIIWFARYLLCEYAKEHQLAIDFNIITDVNRNIETENTTGEHKQENYLSKKHEINLFVGGLANKNKTLKDFLFTTFHELGHVIINESTRKEFMISLGLEYRPLYSKKNYEIKKEQRIVKMIGQEQYEQLHDFWLYECEADIIGGAILLNIINDNFGDRHFFDEVKKYVEQCINRAKLIIYSPDREELTKDYDRIIIYDPDFNRSSYFLRVEYNENGDRKNLVQLLKKRKQIHSELMEQTILHQFSAEYAQKIIAPKYKEIDELISGFLYKVLEQCTEVEFVQQLANATEDELNFISESINIKEMDLRNALDFIKNCDNETPLRIRTENYLLDKMNNCLRMKHEIEKVLLQGSSYFNPNK